MHEPDLTAETALAALQSDLARYRPRINAELAAAVCRRLPTIIAIEATVAAGLIISFVWEVATPLQMAAWLGVHYLIVLLHGVVYLRFRSEPVSERVRTELLQSAVAVGIYWAAVLGYMFLVTPSYLYHLYLYLFVGMLGVVGLAMMSEQIAALVAFVLPSAIVLSVLSIRELQVNYISLGVLGGVCTIGIIAFARAKESGIIRSLAMRFALLDVTAELTVQRDAAQRANVAKSKFLAAASHDLRQPLHALTLLHAALQEQDIGGSARNIANDMNKSIQSLEKMFGALLDISKLDAGVLSPEVCDFALHDVLESIAAEYSLPAQAKGLGLVYEECDWIVRTDPLLMERVVRNYVANAVRYTRSGYVRIATHRSGSDIRIEVTDTGIGIAPEQQTEIFDEFYQVDNPERDRSKGLGLGLAIVRRVADLLGIEYGVRSKVAEGSVFFVTVPLGRSEAVQVQQIASAPTSGDLTGLRVVVIDDDIAVRESMYTLLRSWRCQVIAAPDVEQALMQARTDLQGADALIVDYRLREHQTGTQAIATLTAALGVTVPSLIVSGDTAPERLRDVSMQGFTLVHKPIQPAILRAFLASAQRIKQTGS